MHIYLHILRNVSTNPRFMGHSVKGSREQPFERPKVISNDWSWNWRSCGSGRLRPSPSGRFSEV